MSTDEGSFEPLINPLPESKKVRLGMLKGEKPGPCERCWKVEEGGVPSFRQRSEFLFDKIPLDPNEEDPVPYYYDIRVGRICNLACKMCFSDASTRWDEVVRKLKWLPVVHEDANYNWFSEPNNQLMLKESIGKSISKYGEIQLLFGGGEALLHKQCIKFISSLDDVTKSSINLSFVTNCTMLPESFFDIIKPFKSVKFHVSLEGVGRVNDFIRFPSVFSEIRTNFMAMIEHGYDVEFVSTLQVYNIWNFWEVAELASSLGKKVSYHPVIDPGYLNIDGLPIQILSVGAKKAHQSILSGKLTEQAKEQVLSCISMIQKAEFVQDENKITELLKFTAKIERGDSATFQSCIPELYRAVQRFNKIQR